MLYKKSCGCYGDWIGAVLWKVVVGGSSSHYGVSGCSGDGGVVVVVMLISIMGDIYGSRGI